MILEVLVGAFGLFVLAAVYLTLAPGDRRPGDCASCSLEEDPTLCGGCGLPETPPPDAEPPDPPAGSRDRGRRRRGTNRTPPARQAGTPRRRDGERNGTREEAR